jgi:hypothetical protein
MQHTLLSRFRGTLLGAVMGETYPQRPAPRIASRASATHGPASTYPHPVPLSQTIATATTTLIHQQLQATGSVPPAPAKTLSEYEILGALLPVILYFHEAPQELQRQIQQHLPPSASPELKAGAEVISGVIAHILQEQGSLNTFIPDLLSERSSSPGGLLRPVESVQDLLSSRASLHTAVQTLISTDATDNSGFISAIALALYGWLSTPEQGSLSILRVQHITRTNRNFIAALTGAFSGAHNGPFEMLNPWHTLCSPRSESVPTAAQMLSLADQLFATWSGVLQPLHSLPVEQHIKGAAIAAPGIMRPFRKGH